MITPSFGLGNTITELSSITFKYYIVMKKLQMLMILFLLTFFVFGVHAQHNAPADQNDRITITDKEHKQKCSAKCLERKNDTSEMTTQAPIVALDGIEIAPSYGDRSACCDAATTTSCKKKAKTSSNHPIGKQVKAKASRKIKTQFLQRNSQPQ